MIIGITGFFASGKDTMGEILAKKGFLRLSCSDYLRERAKEKNIEITRDNLVKIGNNLREKYGSNILAEKLIEKINKHSPNQNFVIESIRTVKEIESFRTKLRNFTLVFINTDAKLRYKRAKIRNKEKEHIKSFKDFIASEKREMNDTDNNAMQLHKCRDLADISITNNGTIKELELGISNLLVKLQIQSREKPDWHRYFLNVAKDIATRSTCLSAHAGAVITKDNVIIATGYIGAPRNTKDCYEKGYCIRRKMNIPSGHRYEICASVHAEQNAMINASRQNVSTLGATLYLYGYKMYEGIKKIYNAFPCFICKKMIINAGIEKFIAQQEDGSYKIYEVSKWVKEWQKKDIVDDQIFYDAKYK